MRTLVRLLAILSASAGAPGLARAETVYVALGGWHAVPGAARPGDPARIAAQLRLARPPVRLVDLTAEGATVRDVRRHQLPRALALRQRLVTLAVGPGELADGVALAAFWRDLHAVTDLLRRNGATVAVSTLPPAEWLREAPTPAFRRRVDAFNWAIRRDAERNGVRVAVIGATDAAPAAAWEASVVAALLDAPRPGRPAPRERAVEPPPDVGAAPATRAAGERVLAVRPRPGSRARAGAKRSRDGGGRGGPARYPARWYSITYTATPVTDT